MDRRAFGSRGLGHASATKYLKSRTVWKVSNVAPASVATDTDLGCSYLAAMDLAGRYAYAGRDWVEPQGADDSLADGAWRAPGVRAERGRAPFVGDISSLRCKSIS